MVETSSFKTTADENRTENQRTHVHEYHFDYDVNGETTLESTLVDVMAFVLNCPRAEAERAFSLKEELDVNQHFSMLDRLQKSELAFWIGDLKFVVGHDGEIAVRQY